MSETKYVFWVELRDGQELRWSGLTRHQVVCMHKWTEHRIPPQVKAFGWEESK
jgi:hypothetical protein